MSFETAAASSATASPAAEASSGAPRAMCIPPRTGAGSGSCSRPRSSALRRPAAHAESTTACTSPMPPPAACSNRSAIALCASFARCASSSLRRRRSRLGPRGCAPPSSTRSATRTRSTRPSRKRLRMRGSTPGAISSPGRRPTCRASGTTRPCGPSFGQETRSPPERSALPDTYGGGFVQILFTRRPWRRHGVGAALLADAFRRLWEGGERSVGLGVDTESGTGAFRLYERAGMTPTLGWVQYEKALGPTG